MTASTGQPQADDAKPQACGTQAPEPPGQAPSAPACADASQAATPPPSGTGARNTTAPPTRVTDAGQAATPPPSGTAPRNATAPPTAVTGAGRAATLPPSGTGARNATAPLPGAAGAGQAATPAPLGAGAHQAPLCVAVLESVQGVNRQGRAANLQEVLASLAEAGYPVQDQQVAGQVEALLADEAVFASFTGISGHPLHHDPAVLSGAYARIIDRKANPVHLMAEEIRTNSRDYPRPVPVELFESSPFDLTPEDMRQALEAMSQSPDYADITYTTVQSGGVYLFSSRHLERSYAQFLAERAENLADNP